MRLLVKFAFIVSIIIYLSACASAPPVVDSVAGASESFQVLDEYKLGSGDKIRVIVYGEPDLSGEFVVDGSGTISMPLVGEIEAAGQTIRTFQRALETSLLDGYLTDPRVSAEVLNFRPFYILGEIEEAGEYPYIIGLTVLNAIATAGGFTYRANKRQVFIKHAGASDEQAYDLEASTPVRPGDTLRIPERFF